MKCNEPDRTRELSNACARCLAHNGKAPKMHYMLHNECELWLRHSVLRYNVCILNARFEWNSSKLAKSIRVE